MIFRTSQNGIDECRFFTFKPAASKLSAKTGHLAE
jgi:hypothetical protein